MGKYTHDINNFPVPYVALLVGPVLSGKTVFRKENFPEHTIISRDDILMSLHHNNNYEEAFKSVNQKEVTRLLKEQMSIASEEKKNIVIDMTNLSPKRRRDTLSYFDDYYKVAFVFPILDRSEYDKRNEKRFNEENKYLSKQVIDDMINSYRPITYEEGFDKVIYI